jgi:hypothetical protein
MTLTAAKSYSQRQGGNVPFCFKKGTIGWQITNQINMPPNSQMYAGAGVLSSCMSINPMPQMMKISSYQQVVSFSGCPSCTF